MLGRTNVLPRHPPPRLLPLHQPRWHARQARPPLGRRQSRRPRQAHRMPPGRTRQKHPRSDGGDGALHRHSRFSGTVAGSVAGVVAGDRIERGSVAGVEGAQCAVGDEEGVQAIRVQESRTARSSESDRRAELSPVVAPGAEVVGAGRALVGGGDDVEANPQDFLELHPILLAQREQCGWDGEFRPLPGVGESQRVGTVVRGAQGGVDEIAPGGIHGPRTHGSTDDQGGTKRLAVVEGEEVGRPNHDPSLLPLRHPQLRRGRSQRIRQVLLPEHRPLLPGPRLRNPQPPPQRTILHRSRRPPVPQLRRPRRGTGAHVQTPQTPHGLFAVQGVLPRDVPDGGGHRGVRERSARVRAQAKLAVGGLLRSEDERDYAGDERGEVSGAGYDAAAFGVFDGDFGEVQFDGGGGEESHREGLRVVDVWIPVGDFDFQKEVRDRIGGADGFQRLPRF
mmetsp:Transcript_2395/g.5538  ORF Transcript_2395/g.5538 Transcript_2395/m.5538 type:complete len:450 (-) Transcript_2395:399-1748(-)